ncbi:MAG: type IV pilus assembly protein PilM [Phycisphaerae bacterium]|nr:type IV pilus assembly protein PilM [Phycisphaerae bacterium]MBN8598477.1 type IV pilus assembly protein PilM [Planctomycetota bacterium]
MPSSNICWGIEIGAAAIKAVKIENAGDRVNVLDMAIIDHPRTLSTPGVDPADVLRVSLGTLVSQYDLSKTQIAVSVPGHSSFARFAKLPPVEPKKVPDIVKFEAMQQIPFPLEQVEWDYQTFISPDSPEIEVGIFAITRERISERLTMLQDVGLTPGFVTLGPIAVFNALAYDLDFNDKTPGTIVVDIGTTSTDLVISEAGRMWVRTFPLGGHQFTEALVSAFQIGYPKAEKLKQEAEDSKHARQVFQAMRPVFTDLGQDIQRSIGYYQSLHKDANLQRVILIGATANLPGLRKYLKQQLGIEVYRVEEFKKANLLPLDGGKDGGERAAKFKDRALDMTTAFGLALQGIGAGTINANLMPVTIIREAMWKGKVKWFGAAAGIVAAAGAAMFVRPFLDSNAVAASAADPEVPQIRQTISEGNNLKRLAEEAGVVGAPPPDERATKMVAMLDNRTFYPHLVNDVGLMVEDSNQRAATWAKDVGSTAVVPEGFHIDKMTTAFFAPGGADASGGMGGQPIDTSANAPLGPADRPRVVVTLVATTNQPEAQKFILATFDSWLRKNAARPGVPYEIFVSPTPWRQEIAGAGANTPAYAGAPTPAQSAMNQQDSSKGGSLETMAPIAGLKPPPPEGLPPPTTFTISFTASKLPAQPPEAKP